MIPHSLLRTLQLITEYAVSLNTQSEYSHEQKIQQFLNFLPVLAYEGDSMYLVDAKQALEFSYSGIGMSMAANKHKKIRAAVCYSVKNTKLSRLHNNANIITLGSRLTKKNTAFKCIEVFMNTKFEGGRHKRRVKKI